MVTWEAETGYSLKFLDQISYIHRSNKEKEILFQSRAEEDDGHLEISSGLHTCVVLHILPELTGTHTCAHTNTSPKGKTSKFPHINKLN